ncbi:hypothetical protein LY76DRAFT_592607 [Colletotrichum caudatum]|nr:hypothetical protein LY76DRAFT_592607 [Colletotrichum caudatum]
MTSTTMASLFPPSLSRWLDTAVGCGSIAVASLPSSHHQLWTDLLTSRRQLHLHIRSPSRCIRLRQGSQGPTPDTKR